MCSNSTKTQSLTSSLYLMSESYLIAGDLVKSSSASRGNGVYQEQPTCKDTWKAWRKACKLFCVNDKWKLKTPLGRWRYPNNELRRIWKYSHSKGEDCLFRAHDLGCTKLKPSNFQFFGGRRFVSHGALYNGSVIFFFSTTSEVSIPCSNADCSLCHL